MKKKLKDVTLVAIGCSKLEETIIALNVCKHYMDFKSVKLFTQFDCTLSEVVNIRPLNYNEYNTFMVKELYQYIDTSHMLFIHPDGFILNPDAWNDEWLEYDYIGAPWWFNDDINVGNGGFTLRSLKFLKTTALDENIKPIYGQGKNVIYNGFTPEDCLLCRHYGPYLKSIGIKFAPEEVAMRFSIEPNAKYGSVWKDQFGFHNLHTDLSTWKRPIL